MPLKIRSILPGSLAAQEGLQANDIIISINENPINDFLDLQFFGAEASFGWGAYAVGNTLGVEAATKFGYNAVQVQVQALFHLTMSTQASHYIIVQIITGELTHRLQMVMEQSLLPQTKLGLITTHSI